MPQPEGKTIKLRLDLSSCNLKPRREAPMWSEMSYSLRPAVAADLLPMMAIGHEGIRPYIEAKGDWDPTEQERGFREHFTPESVAIVQVEGHDAGYVKVEERADHLFLEGIYLGAHYRRRGIGAAVIRDVIEHARRAGKPLRLRVLRPNPAQHLYERLGFRTTEVTDTHVHMELSPAPA